jgi:OTU domain-containing protein 6
MYHIFHLGTIQNMKKHVNKSDKKKKKDLAEEIAKMEADLEAKHKAELDAFIPGGKKLFEHPTEIPETVHEEPQHEILTSEINGHHHRGSSAPGTPKMSRARKRREKKEADEKEKQKRIVAESSILLENSQMKAEDDAFIKLMNDLNLGIVDIDPDGNWWVNLAKMAFY